MKQHTVLLRGAAWTAMLDAMEIGKPIFVSTEFFKVHTIVSYVSKFKRRVKDKEFATRHRVVEGVEGVWIFRLS